jgi:hypothetical protein
MLHFYCFFFLSIFEILMEHCRPISTLKPHCHGVQVPTEKLKKFHARELNPAGMQNVINLSLA